MNNANSLEIIMVCNKRLIKCELVLNFEKDPESPGRVRPVYDIETHEIKIENENLDNSEHVAEFSVARYLPGRTVMAATTNGNIYHYDVGNDDKSRNRLISKYTSPDGVGIIELLPTYLYMVCVKSNK